MVPRTRTRGRGRRGWWFLLGLGVAALLSGGVPLLAQTADGVATQDAGSVPWERPARAGPAGTLHRPARASPSIPAATTGRAAALRPPPVRMRLPRLNIDAPVLPVSVGAGGLLGVPDNPRELGWWSGSSRPGMPSGSVVLDGHVDSATLGLGALFRLREARPGDEMLLMNAAGAPTRYTVVARRSYPKASLPVGDVFAQDVGPRLVLLTCGGRFDQATGHYADNVVVYAVPR